MRDFSFKSLNEISGLKVIEPFCSDDERGSFCKTFERSVFKANGSEFEISEIFQSVSKAGVLRGLHMQHTRPQHKLVYCVSGEVFDVAVDARRDSPTFGKYFSIKLSGENRKMFYIPAGFFHGFLALTDNAILTYICAGDFVKEYDGGIRWNDEDINVEWPLDSVGELTISDKDRQAPSFKEYCEKFSW